MRYAVSGTQMKQIDHYAIYETGIPSMVLMERAALAFVTELAARIRDGAHILLVCGNGNNGADGLAAARMLYQRGYPVTVYAAADPDRGTEEYRMQHGICEKLGIPLTSDTDVLSGKFEVLVDALFGIGLNREIEGTKKELLERVIRIKADFSAAIDIPSGIYAGTGQVMGIAWKVDMTVTFGCQKLGMLLYPGREYAGEVLVRDIGFPEAALKMAGREAYSYDESDLCRLPKRKPDSNKGSFGKVLLVAGSEGMSGAAYLSALAAYRMGAGLVRILTPEANRIILQSLIPEAVLETCSEEILMNPTEKFQQWMEELVGWADVIVLGPGLGKSEGACKLVEGILSHTYVPVVLDADGLNLVAEHPYLTGYFTENIIITPHPGEMARLTARTVQEVCRTPVQAARDYSSLHGVVCVLKMASTVIADKDGNTFVNTSGSSALAKAGSGDVLTGVIGALLAQGMEPMDAAALGVYVHGLAGEAAEAEQSCYGVLARETADACGRLCRDVF